MDWQCQTQIVLLLVPPPTDERSGDLLRRLRLLQRLGLGSSFLSPKFQHHHLWAARTVPNSRRTLADPAVFGSWRPMVPSVNFGAAFLLLDMLPPFQKDGLMGKTLPASHRYDLVWASVRS